MNEYFEPVMSDRGPSTFPKAALGLPEIEAALARGYREGGYRRAMMVAAERMSSQPGVATTNPFVVAQLYAHAGAEDQAIEWLEKAYVARDPDMAFLGVALAFLDLRDDQRFQDLLRRMNLPS